MAQVLNRKRAKRGGKNTVAPRQVNSSRHLLTELVEGLALHVTVHHRMHIICISASNSTPPSYPSGASSPDLALPPFNDGHHPIVSIWTNMPMPHVIEQWACHIWSSPTPGTPVIVPHNNSQRPSIIFLSRSFPLTDSLFGPSPSTPSPTDVLFPSFRSLDTAYRYHTVTIQ